MAKKYRGPSCDVLLTTPWRQLVYLSSIAINEAPLLDAFDFEHDGKRFSCRIEAATGGRKDAWWWFGVSTDDRHRYAPFRATDDDKQADIQERVVTYYHDLMVRRAEPVASHWRRGLRPAPAVAAAPVVADSALDAELDAEIDAEIIAEIDAELEGDADGPHDETEPSTKASA